MREVVVGLRGRPVSSLLAAPVFLLFTNFFAKISAAVCVMLLDDALKDGAAAGNTLRRKIFLKTLAKCLIV